MGEVKASRALYIFVIGFVIALEIIVGLFYTVIIGGEGGWFNDSEKIMLNFTYFIVFIFPYIILCMLWKKLQLGFCKNIYIYIIVLLLGLAIVGLDLWVWDVLTKGPYSDGGEWFIVALGKAIQIVLSLVIWITLLFLLKEKGGRIDTPQPVDRAKQRRV